MLLGNTKSRAVSFTLQQNYSRKILAIMAYWLQCDSAMIFRTLSLLRRYGPSNENDKQCFYTQLYTQRHSVLIVKLSFCEMHSDLTSEYRILMLRSCQPTYFGTWKTRVDARHAENTRYCISRDSNRRLQMQVYIQFIEQSYVQSLIHDTQVHAEYKHITGALSKVNLTCAGMGTKTFRITNISPDVTHAKLITVLAPHGAILSITDEIWTPQYRFHVHSGVRRVSFQLTKNIPSLLIVAAHRVLRIYTRGASCSITGLANREYRQT
jgi:hypothetical protein